MRHKGKSCKLSNSCNLLSFTKLLATLLAWLGHASKPYINTVFVCCLSTAYTLSCMQFAAAGRDAAAAAADGGGNVGAEEDEEGDEEDNEVSIKGCKTRQCSTSIHTVMFLHVDLVRAWLQGGFTNILPPGSIHQCLVALLLSICKLREESLLNSSSALQLSLTI